MAAMTREHRFGVHVAWEGDRLTTAYVDGKQPLSVATPPEFRGTNPDVWSPEDLLVAAAASCFAVTIDAVAEAQQLTIANLDVRSVGIVGRRTDGEFGFVRIEQSVELEVARGDETRARAVVEKAEQMCLVSVSLDVPIETVILVQAAAERRSA